MLRRSDLGDRHTATKICEHNLTFWYVLRLKNIIIKNPGPLRFELTRFHCIYNTFQIFPFSWSLLWSLLKKKKKKSKDPPSFFFFFQDSYSLKGTYVTRSINSTLRKVFWKIALTFTSTKIYNKSTAWGAHAWLSGAWLRIKCLSRKKGHNSEKKNAFLHFPW